MDLFSTLKQPEPPKEVATAPTLVHSEPKQKTEPKSQPPKKIIPQSEAKDIYDQVIAHLSKTEIPPFSAFHLKTVHPNAFKWCLDGCRFKSDGTPIKSDQLVLFWRVERDGQNADRPDAKYFEWEELYSRSLKADLKPKGMGLKPKKPRAARGSRSRMTREKDAS